MEPGECDPRTSILLAVVKSFHYPLKFAETWIGNNPCDSFYGIRCYNGDIIGLDFKNMGLAGSISPQLSLLHTLKSINLSGNKLTGTIPTVITTMRSLEKLDVSDNQLTGVVPKL